jgi:hypothetical protein
MTSPRQCLSVGAAIYECACWMVRSIARFLIRIESNWRSQRG